MKKADAAQKKKFELLEKKIRFGSSVITRHHDAMRQLYHFCTMREKIGVKSIYLLLLTS